MVQMLLMALFRVVRFYLVLDNETYMNCFRQNTSLNKIFSNEKFTGFQYIYTFYVIPV
jgi:hypothetical protein